MTPISAIKGRRIPARELVSVDDRWAEAAAWLIDQARSFAGQLRRTVKHIRP